MKVALITGITGQDASYLAEYLLEKGYKVYGTTPHTDDCLIQDIPLDNKVALMFGTELTGLSDIAMANVDGFVKIPMYGFTESLNISVSASICLYELKKRLKNSDINWQLPEDDKLDQLIVWAKKVIKDGTLIEKQYLEKLGLKSLQDTNES